MKDLDAIFSPPQESVSWAYEAIDELRATLDAFFGDEPAHLVVEPDFQRGEHVFILEMTSELPSKARRKAIESLERSRNSFDQTVTAGMIALGHTVRETKSVNFPWSENPTDFGKRFERKRIDGRLKDVLARHEPYPTSQSYPGGHDLIRSLATVTNKKHTVGLAVSAALISSHLPNMIGSFETMQIIKTDRRFVKKRKELARVRGDFNLHGKYEFTFAVSLEQAFFGAEVDAIAALELFAGKAKSVLEDVKGECAKMIS